MAYGEARHLWIDGVPAAGAVREWIDKAQERAWGAGYGPQTAAMRCRQLDGKLTCIELTESGLGSVKTGSSTEEPIPILHGLAAAITEAGFECTLIEMSDTGGMSWSIETFGKVRIGARMVTAGEAWDADEDADEAEEAEAWAPVHRTLSSDGRWRIDAAAPDVARNAIRAIVNLPLEEVYHYIDWALHWNDAVANGGPVEGFASTGSTELLPPLYLVWNGKPLANATAPGEMGWAWKTRPGERGGGAPGDGVAALALWLCIQAVRWIYILLIAVVAPPAIFTLVFQVHPSPAETAGTVILMVCGTLTVSLITPIPMQWQRRAAIMVLYDLGVAAFCFLRFGRDG
jgi:hypothetical protein